MSNLSSNLLPLRKHFWSCSIALASSLTTSAIVTLPADRIWAQETAGQAADEKSNFSRTEFQKMLQSQKLKDAAEMLDAAIASQPDNVELFRENLSLISALSRTDRNAALARMQSLLNRFESLEKVGPAEASSYMSTISVYMNLFNDTKGTLAALDKAEVKLKNSPIAPSLQSLRVQTLYRGEQYGEVKKLLDDVLAKAGDGKEYLTPAQQYLQMLSEKYANESKTVEAKAMKIADSLVAGESVSREDYMVYSSFMQSRISSLSRSEPKQALVYLAAVEAAFAKFKASASGDNGDRLVQSMSQNLDRLKKSIETEIKRAELIGQPAKDFGDFADSNYLVGMKEKSLAELKGKVVLLDFWAVWCGPCIATFPHLKEWHDQYSSKGLVIVGATKFYNYDWNETTGKAQRSQDEVPTDKELKMLELFRESYGLKHGFVVTNKENDYGSHFMVTGIPQAVLLDKSGKVRMIRVGSGDKNAADLHHMIEQLLAE